MNRQASNDSLGGCRATLLAAVVVILFCAGAPVLHAAEPSPSVAVTVNQSEVVTLAQRVKRVSVTQPEVADVHVVAPNQLLINGKNVGTTSLITWDEKGVVTKYELVVLADVASLRRQLRALFPEEKIEVTTSGPAIVLRGEVSNEVVYDKVLEITQTYLPPKPPEEVTPAPTQTVSITAQPRLPSSGVAFAGGGNLAFPEEVALTDVDRWANRRRIPGIVDLLVIRENRQIQVDVIVAEVSLTKLRELGLDFQFFGHGNAILSRAGSQGPTTPGDLIANPSTFPPTTTIGPGASAAISRIAGNFALSTVFRLIQDKDIAEILAQPSLVIKNGRSGGFLAGGEIPVPVREVGVAETTTNVEFKPFGVRLDFLPTITWSNAIDLRIFPEVSEPDFGRTVLGIPSFTVRRTVSRVEMKEGESLILSGLFSRQVLKELSKFPLLGDIPILGALFRSTRFRDEEKELVFVITPKIVRPLKPGEKPRLPSLEKYDDPDIRQVPLPGAAARPSGVRSQGATIP